MQSEHLESWSDVLRQARLQVQPLEHELSMRVEAVQPTVVGLANAGCSHRREMIIEDTSVKRVHDDLHDHLCHSADRRSYAGTRWVTNDETA